MTRQQRRFDARKGARTVGFDPMPDGKHYRRLPRAAASQQFQMLPNGGYQTLHATKGWRTVSPKRLRFVPGFVQ